MGSSRTAAAEVTGGREVQAPAFVPDAATDGLVRGPVRATRYAQPRTGKYEAAGLLASLVPAGARVLDVGCASGAVAMVLAEACGGEVVGVEPDASRAEVARAKGLRVVNDVLGPHLADQLGRFDRVVLADVIEHVPDPAALLRTAAAFVAPGGRLLVSVPNVAHWTVRAALLRGRFEYTETGIMDATHLRWFTLQSIRRLVGAVGPITAERYSAGLSLAAYRRRPWRWLPGSVRNRLIVGAARAVPTVAALQFVLEVAVDAEGGDGATIAR